MPSLKLTFFVVKVARTLLTSVGSLKIKLNKMTDGHLHKMMLHT